MSVTNIFTDPYDFHTKLKSTKNSENIFVGVCRSKKFCGDNTLGKGELQQLQTLQRLDRRVEQKENRF